MSFGPYLWGRVQTRRDPRWVGRTGGRVSVPVSGGFSVVRRSQSVASPLSVHTLRVYPVVPLLDLWGFLGSTVTLCRVGGSWTLRPKGVSARSRTLTRISLRQTGTVTEVFGSVVLRRSCMSGERSAPPTMPLRSIFDLSIKQLEDCSYLK